MSTFIPQGAENVDVAFENFNASQITQFSPAVLAFTFATFYQDTFTHPDIDQFDVNYPDCPLNRSTYNPCTSYYFPSVGMTPTVDALSLELQFNVSFEWDILEFPRQPGMSINFWPTNINDLEYDGPLLEGLNSSDFECTIFGAPNEAFQFCLGDSTYLKPHLVAGPI